MRPGQSHRRREVSVPEPEPDIETVDGFEGSIVITRVADSGTRRSKPVWIEANGGCYRQVLVREAGFDRRDLDAELIERVELLLPNSTSGGTDAVIDAHVVLRHRRHSHRRFRREHVDVAPVVVHPGRRVLLVDTKSVPVVEKKTRERFA